MREHLRSGLTNFSNSLENLKDKTKMQIKYFLLVLTALCSQNIASSHILTSTYVEMSLPVCMRMLTYAVMNDLCPTYGDYSSEYIPPMAQELQLEYKENIIKKCCTKPCTLIELIEIC